MDEDISEGDKARWNGGGGNAYGVVEDIETNGTLEAKPKGPEMEGTEEDPAYGLRNYEIDDGEWVETDVYVVHRRDAITVIGDFPEAESKENNEKDLSEKVSENAVDTDELKTELKQSFESQIKKELENIKQDIQRAESSEHKDPEDEWIDESLELENLKKKKELREQKLQLIKDLREGEV